MLEQNQHHFFVICFAMPLLVLWPLPLSVIHFVLVPLKNLLQSVVSLFHASLELINIALSWGDISVYPENASDSRLQIFFLDVSWRIVSPSSITGQ